MNDLRQGIVRLELPDGRTIPLTLTYERLDVFGHGWVIEQFEAVQKSKAGSSAALGHLIELLTNGEITAGELAVAPTGTYPMTRLVKAAWDCWTLAQYGPDGKPEKDPDAVPPKARQTWWKRLVGHR